MSERTMIAYDDTMTLADARQVYFDANGFGDGGYTKDWVTFKLGPFPVGFPNTAGRKLAVRFHDLHHVVTGFPTTTAGEGMIGAWELATGCATMPAALALNFTAFAGGIVLAPGAVYRAWVRGRHTDNLYREPFGDALLAETVGIVRARLHLTDPQPLATVADAAGFGVMVALGVVALVVFWSVMIVPIAMAVAIYMLVLRFRSTNHTEGGEGKLPGV